MRAKDVTSCKLSYAVRDTMYCMCRVANNKDDNDKDNDNKNNDNNGNDCYQWW